MTDVEHRIAKAKTKLILDHPFFGSICLGLPLEYSDEVPTAGTDGKRIIFNPQFVDTLNDDELVFVLAHECMHPMLQHCWRKGERDHMLWNVACDFPINHVLTDEGVGQRPSGALFDQSIMDKGEGQAEKIYRLLHDNSKKYGEIIGTGPLDDCMDGEQCSPAEVEQAMAEWKVKAAQAANAAKMQGKLSANMRRFVDSVVQPKVDWREQLQKFVVKCKDDTRTWARPNRRFISQGLYMPTCTGETMPPIAIAIDCSGSVGSEELSQFAAEITAIKEDLNPHEIRVVYFDSKVCHVDVVGKDDELDIQPHGGGGTNFAPIFEDINETDTEYACCVVLTDMYCNSFGDMPEYPVMWVSTSSIDEAPFGEVVRMEL